MKFANRGKERSNALIVLDLIGLLIASGAIAYVAMLNKTRMDSEVRFELSGLVTLLFLFSTMYLLISFKLGNRKWFGLPCLFMTALAGSLLYVCVSILLSAFWSGPESIAVNGYISYLIIFCFLFIVSFAIAFIVRLLGLLLVGAVSLIVGRRVQ